ncbi:hypothetical protein Patl1_06187 [Pistacia atlantica]|uniref:Uncharacterized protein n=1 Tax=Pistacia atlantica TaxID=434234 RepID=A0ACC1BQS8_9ROSI|nr:hypothetical protein Patl1_06187 [Pistacia atlantica]
MAQKHIWSGIPLFPILVMFLISHLAETNRAPFDLLEAETESIGYVPHMHGMRSHAGKLARVVLAGDPAPFDLPEAEAESVAGYNVEYARDAILNSPLLAEANVPGSRGLILTETRGGSLPTSKYSILGKPAEKRMRALVARLASLLLRSSLLFILLGVGACP